MTETEAKEYHCSFCGSPEEDCAFINVCDVCKLSYCDDCSPHRTDDAPIDLCEECIEK